jgi:hypothetical protein
VRRVLLLNLTHEPLTTVGLRRAVCLVLCGKAEVTRMDHLPHGLVPLQLCFGCRCPARSAEKSKSLVTWAQSPSRPGPSLASTLCTVTLASASCPANSLPAAISTGRPAPASAARRPGMARGRRHRPIPRAALLSSSGRPVTDPRPSRTTRTLPVPVRTARTPALIASQRPRACYISISASASASSASGLA